MLHFSLVVLDERLRQYIAANLLPQLTERLAERDPDAIVSQHRARITAYSSPYDLDRRFCDTLEASLDGVSHVLIGLRGNDSDEFKNLATVQSCKKSCVVIVQSSDPSVYRRISAIHQSSAFDAIIAVGGPNKVETLFPGKPVFPVFDLEHNQPDLARELLAKLLP